MKIVVSTKDTNVELLNMDLEELIRDYFSHQFISISPTLELNIKVTENKT